MRQYTVHLLLQTALHVSGSDATHHQERIQLHSQHLILVVGSELLPPAIVVREREVAAQTLRLEPDVVVSNCPR
jgi:hypothetical protein